MTTPFDLHPHSKPIPVWFAALLIVGASMAGIVGAYYTLILIINFIGR